MKTLMVFHWEGVTPTQYDEVIRFLNWTVNRPKSLLFHVAGFTINTMLVVDT